MSLSRLPPEIKAIIVDLCHTADERYNARLTQRERDFKKVPLGVVRGDPGGRSVFALSLVNQELRTFCHKWIFQVRTERCALPSRTDSFCIYSQTLTLPNPLADQPGALRTILSGPVGSAVKQLKYTPTLLEESVLLPFLHDDSELLPNLKEIIGLKPLGIKILCGRMTPNMRSSHGKDWWRREQEEQTRTKFQTLSQRITSWDLVDPEAASLEMVVKSNPDGIHHLSLHSQSKSFNAPSFASPDCRIPRILAQATNLRSLSIRNPAPLDPPNSYQPIHDNALDISYAFASSLTSLALDFEDHGSHHCINTLKFAALFPSLRSLRLNTSCPALDSSSTESITFSHLTTLQVRLDDLWVVTSPRLPSLRHLHILASGSDWLAVDLENDTWPELLSTFAEELARHPTLRNVHFDTQPGTPLSFRTIRIFQKAFEGTLIKIHTDFLVGTAEASFPFAHPEVSTFCMLYSAIH